MKTTLLWSLTAICAVALGAWVCSKLNSIILDHNSPPYTNLSVMGVLNDMPSWMAHDPGWEFLKLEIVYTNTIKGGTMTHLIDTKTNITFK